MAKAKKDLGEFEGQKIAGTTIALRNAGDGLSQAMKVDPTILHHGETVYVVYETRVIDVQHPEIKDSDEVMRKHVLKAGTATIIDGAAVKKAIAEQADRIQKHRDEQTGAQALEVGKVDTLATTPASERAKAPAAKKARAPRKPRPSRAKGAAKASHLSSVPS